MARSVDEALDRVALDRPYRAEEVAAAASRLAARLAAAHLPAQRGGSAASGRNPAARHLDILCGTVVGRADALAELAAFLGRRIPGPAGARVLGCALHLAGQEDGARFWWQFAAGAGDGPAAYCLRLHHLALGEDREAGLWHPDEDGPADGSDPALVLRVLTLLHGEDGAALGGAASAVVHYVPTAVRFVDDCELPLPEADFPRHIEDLAAAG
jgi:hypothetical protein